MFQSVQHVLITKLDLVFQLLAKFLDSCNVAFKSFPEGTAILNTNSSDSIYHIVTLIFIVIVTTLSITCFNILGLVVLVFGGYLGGACIVRCCV